MSTAQLTQVARSTATLEDSDLPLLVPQADAVVQSGNMATPVLLSAWKL